MQICSQRQTLQMFAAATWQSFVALTYQNGLPADQINAAGQRAQFTSPTNIGSYIWSTLAARDLHLITSTETCARLEQTLRTVATLERHADSGQFYNWYDPVTAAKLTTWPTTGDRLYPFLSSVDNGWLATALLMVANSLPHLGEQANAILQSMNFGFYYDANAGLLRGGYWPHPPPRVCTANGFTCHHYGALNTETRIASYVGIALGQLPSTHYFKMARAIPRFGTNQPQKAHTTGFSRQYLGVDVFEGCQRYRGLTLVPSWGGSMFEALMVPLFVPEAEWGPRSWGVNHPLYVQAQILHGIVEAQYGYWGFSPANNPAGGYREYGVDAIGMAAKGYPSNNDNVLIADDSADGRLPLTYTNGVVTPHAVFLALAFAPAASLANLAKLRLHFDLYGPWGFWDAVNVSTGALDQGMIMMAVANALGYNRTRQYFADGLIEAAIRPLLVLEEFTAGAEEGIVPDALPVDWPIAALEEQEMVAVRGIN